MMAPTSVSSRFRARPVTPLPKSSISFSMASVRPSILATPSPISRTAPTFCLPTDVLTPAIWASISCSRLLINSSKCLRQLAQPGADAAVIDVAAHLHAQAADQARVLGEGNGQTRSVPAGPIGLHGGAQVFRQVNGAFAPGGAPSDVQLHQPLEVGQDSHVTARFPGDYLLHRLARAVVVQQPVHQAAAEELLGVPARLF